MNTLSPHPLERLRTASAKHPAPAHTLAIVGILFLTVGVWVVTALGILAAVIALAPGTAPWNPASVLPPAGYALLLTLLSTGAVALLFVLHRDRKPSLRDDENGLGGFAWDRVDDPSATLPDRRR